VSSLRLSKIFLEAFIQCPWKAKHLKLIQDDPIFTVGRDFHKFAYHFFDINHQPIPFTIKDIEQKASDITSFIRNEVLRQLCRNFVVYEFRRYNALKQIGLESCWKPWKREYPIVTQWLGHEWAVVIDRIDKINNKIIIIEYKTGRIDLRTTRRETALYACLLEQVGIKAQYWGLYNPTYDVRYVGTFAPQTLRALSKRLSNMLRSIEIGEWTRRTGDHCAYCPLLSSCLDYIDLQTELRLDEFEGLAQGGEST